MSVAHEKENWHLKMRIDALERHILHVEHLLRSYIWATVAFAFAVFVAIFLLATAHA